MGIFSFFKSKYKNFKASTLLLGGEIVALKEAGSVKNGAVIELDVPSSVFFMNMDKLTDSFSYNAGGSNKFSLAYSTLTMTARSLGKRLSIDPKHPEKKILADMYVISQEPFALDLLTSFAITLEDTKYKRINLKVVFSANVVIADPKLVLKLLRTERALIKAGYARKSISAWLRETVRIVIEKANVPIEILKLSKDNGTGVVREAFEKSLAKIGLGLNEFKIAQVLTSKKLSKALEEQKQSEADISSAYTEFADSDSEAVVLTKIENEGFGDKDIDVSVISSNIVSDKKAILNMETGEAESGGFSMGNESSLDTVGNLFDTMNDMLSPNIDSVTDKTVRTEKPENGAGGFYESNKEWKSKVTGEKFVTVNFDEDSSGGTLGRRVELDSQPLKTDFSQENIEADSIRYCSSCGRKIAADAAFCCYCGQKQKQV